MWVPFCLMLALQNKQLPLVSKLFSVGVNFIDLKMIPALPLIVIVTVFLVFLCSQHGYCCFSKDHGPSMCFCKTFPFKCPVLSSLSRKFREDPSRTCRSTLHFQNSIRMPAPLLPMKPTTVAGSVDIGSPDDQKWSRGSLAPISRPGPRYGNHV